jgi:hypothetical protein
MMFIALTHPLGAVEVMPMAAYLALPLAALVGTRARLVTRRDVIAMAVRR